ncbi:GNAT family N-acetyltransferase [Vannielia sp. SX4]|uniref:GNAT family N-acetyltransferase n=1 Tax=Vannielia sp. SX4 TaxID=3463852 RepID=UPI004059CEA6
MTEIPTLETERLILRAPDMGDFEPFAAFYASDRAKYVGGPLNREGSWRMLAMEIGHWTLAGFGRWIVDVKGGAKTAGLVGLFAPEGWPEPEIGWDLFAGHEGRGYATEAALAARAYAYDVLGWQTAISLVKPGNEASARVAERMDARPDGDFAHERHGTVHIWRHPGPGSSTEGGMEAYA